MLDAALMQIMARLDRTERALERLRASVSAPGPWTPFTPTLTQSATVAATVALAHYQRLGTTTLVEVMLSVTGAGSAANVVTVTVPSELAAAGTGYFVAGQFVILDLSAVIFYTGAPSPNPATVFRGYPSGFAGALGAAGFTAALAAGDIVYLAAAYEGV